VSESLLGFGAAEGEGEGEALTVGEVVARARHGGGMGASWYGLKRRGGRVWLEWRGAEGDDGEWKREEEGRGGVAAEVGKNWKRGWVSSSNRSGGRGAPNYRRREL
jgi:hypothetical protein